ncbi:MAG TPA: hypothetical protein VN223_03495 [Candidatus Elarobacter sp.]|jgi:hypothetical protein|nr:hypothetical protein [Candidatus Elarobacter sp.]
MPRPTEIQNIIEEAVAEVLDAALPRLRSEIVRRAVEAVESLAPAPGSSPSDLLNAAAASIYESGSQAEILRHLLEGEARFAGRVALFVVKGNAINGWQGIGFEDNDAIKTVSVNTGSGLVGKAIEARNPAAGSPQEFDPGFITAMKSPADDQCLVLPLVVKDKVAAVIYADAGTVPGGTLDASGLQALTRFAAVWLELAALRKASGSAMEEVSQPQPAGTLAASAPASAPATSGSEEDELHKKARRFAKLLVEEIKLYNQPRVEEGRQHKDLYDRLKVDIEKSRSTYDKRYAESAVASADYFTQELIRILAENDASLMGAGFQRS